MNCVIFNHDGSLKAKALADLIIQGDDLTDTIYVGFEGYAHTGFTATAVFVDPADGESTLAAVPSSFTFGDNFYDGYAFVLTQGQTAIAGKLIFSLEVQPTQGAKYSVKTELVVNPSNAVPDVTKITLGQYNNLMSVVNSKQGKYQRHNVLCYMSMAEAEADLENLALLQMAVVLDGNGYRIVVKQTDGTLAILN